MSGNELPKILDIHDVLPQHDAWVYPEYELVRQLREVLTPLTSSAEFITSLDKAAQLFSIIESVVVQYKLADGRYIPAARAKPPRITALEDMHSVQKALNAVLVPDEWAAITVRRQRVRVMGDDHVRLE